MRNQWKGFGPDKGTVISAGQKSSWFESAFIVGFSFGNCCQFVSKGCSDTDQSQQLGRNGLFLKAYPFLTPILETYFRKAYMIFAGGLSTSGVSILEHRKNIFCISGPWGKGPLVGMPGDVSMVLFILKALLGFVSVTSCFANDTKRLVLPSPPGTPKSPSIPDKADIVFPQDLQNNSRLIESSSEGLDLKLQTWALQRSLV